MNRKQAYLSSHARSRIKSCSLVGCRSMSGCCNTILREKRKTRDFFCVDLMHSESRPTSGVFPRDSLLLRSRSRERSQSSVKVVSRPSTPSRSAIGADLMKDRLIAALAEKRDLQRQLIGLKQVVEEFIVRLDFMLKCQSSPEACLEDLRDLGHELGVLVSDVDRERANDSTDSDRLQILVELSKCRSECDSLKEQNKNLTHAIEFLENSRVEQSDMSRNVEELDHSLSQVKRELASRDAEIESLQISHRHEMRRVEQEHEGQIIKLKNSICASNRIIDRWKKIYHEDMMRLQSRIGGTDNSTVLIKQST